MLTCVEWILVIAPKFAVLMDLFHESWIAGFRILQKVPSGENPIAFVYFICFSFFLIPNRINSFKHPTKCNLIYHCLKDWNLGEIKSTAFSLQKRFIQRTLITMCGCCPDLFAEDLDGFKGKMPKGQAGHSCGCLRLRLLVECSGYNRFDACLCTCCVYLSISEYCTAMWQFLIYTKIYREMLESKICVRSSRFQFYPYCSLHMSIQDKLVW